MGGRFVRRRRIAYHRRIQGNYRWQGLRPRGEEPFNMEDTVMKISARNVLKGTVKSVTPGAVNSEVILELPGGAQLVSIITKHSAESLKLEHGVEAYAVIKASNVMIAVD